MFSFIPGASFLPFTTCAFLPPYMLFGGTYEPAWVPGAFRWDTLLGVGRGWVLGVLPLTCYPIRVLWVRFLLRFKADYLYVEKDSALLILMHVHTYSCCTSSCCLLLPVHLLLLFYFVVPSTILFLREVLNTFVGGIYSFCSILLCSPVLPYRRHGVWVGT
jgi:hypothetical protein